MDKVFLHFINISITAGWVVLAVILLRFVLKKAPKWIKCLLWVMVGIRLILPFSIESIFSLIPSSETIGTALSSPRPSIETGFSAVDNQIGHYLEKYYYEGVTVPVNHFANITNLLAIIWLLGVGAMLVYMLVSFFRLKSKLKTATLLRDNIRQSEMAASPFILGMIKPKIYLPYHLDEQSMAFVIAHERTHLKRHDYLIKPLSFVLLVVYWFNPLIWIAYILLCRDIELACDEKVIKEMEKEERQAYSKVLIENSVNRRTIAICPLAFGEVGIKERVRNVMNYKKPAFWIVILAVISCIVVAVCFLTNPIGTTIDARLQEFLNTQTVQRYESDKAEDNFICVDYKILGTKSRGSQTTVYAWVLCEEYSYNDKLKVESGGHMPTVITVKKDGNTYRLVEYWQPRDGSYYVGDIKKEFPFYLWSKALDSQKHIGEQKENCLKSAQTYLGISTSTVGGVDYPTNLQHYVLNTSTGEPVKPYLDLNEEDQTFYYHYSMLSSYIAVGNYELNEDTLTLKTQDDKYTYIFKVKGDSYIFDAAKSSKLPLYRFSEDGVPTVPVPDGAEFVREN